MNKRLSIVKIGGALLESPGELSAFCRAFAGLPDPKILVHGGGQRASALSRRLGHEPLMVGGRRITDDKALEVALMVYAGWANKTLVASLQAQDCPALGLSGADAGWAGDIKKVDGKRLGQLLGLGLVPVLCALTHDGKGQMLNTNADTIAAAVAAAMRTEADCTLMYCFDKPGVLTDVRDEGSLLKTLDRDTCERMWEDGRIAAGMLPKLHNGFRALEEGVQRVLLGAPAMLRPGADRYTELKP